jgi:DNA repair protein RadA/Sms
MTRDKRKSVFECQECGHQTAKWFGQCPGCGSWDTLRETLIARSPASKGHPTQAPLTLGHVSQQKTARILSHIPELDRVLGGGFVNASVLLLGGEPGIGKSTLMLQLAEKLIQQNQTVLYVCGEESPDQLKNRSDRLGLKTNTLSITQETEIPALLGLLSEHPFSFLLVDSVQTLYHPDLSASAGSVSQVRECTAALIKHCKSTQTTAFLVGHINKEGMIAGPKVLEHMVDGVFYFEGDRYQHLRLLRSQKNRFGPAQELGMFHMTDRGLQEIENPSAALLQERPEEAHGSVIFPCMEGTRPLLVEVQVLTAPTHYPSPKRLAIGIDPNRLSLILAVLEKKTGLGLQNQDVFAKIVGGVSIVEPALDLPLALAVTSSFRNQPLPQKLVAFGEIGLSGEIRAVSQADLRLKESRQLGFRQALVPKGTYRNEPQLSLMTCPTLLDALQAAFP